MRIEPIFFQCYMYILFKNGAFKIWFIIKFIVDLKNSQKAKCPCQVKKNTFYVLFALNGARSIDPLRKFVNV